MSVTECLTALGVTRLVWHTSIPVPDELLFVAHLRFHDIVMLPVVGTAGLIGRHPVLQFLDRCHD